MQRFTRFTFSTLWSQNRPLRHLFKVINLTTFPTVSGIFKNSIKGKLAARELTRTRALLEIFCGSSGAIGHGKGLKIRSAAFLFTLSLPLCICVFEASRDLCVATTVKKRANPPRERTEKTWLWFAASDQNATIITNQILRLSSVRVRQTNNDCAKLGAFFPHLPFLYFRLVVLSLGLKSFLACLNLNIIIQDGDSSSRYSLHKAGYLQAFTRNGPKNSRSGYFGRDRLFSNSLKSRYKVRFCLFPWYEKYA